MEIPVGRGLCALVDDDVQPLIGDRKWRVILRRGGRPTSVVSGRGRDFVHLHRLIASPGPGMTVDHINCNTLDNRRANLRVCTVSENARNRSVQKNNKLGLKGVYMDGNSYRAQIRYEKKVYSLGSFATAERAREPYSAAARRLHGEFARLS